VGPHSVRARREGKKKDSKGGRKRGGERRCFHEREREKKELQGGGKLEREKKKKGGGGGKKKKASCPTFKLNIFSVFSSKAEGEKGGKRRSNGEEGKGRGEKEKGGKTFSSFNTHFLQSAFPNGDGEESRKIKKKRGGETPLFLK